MRYDPELDSRALAAVAQDQERKGKTTSQDVQAQVNLCNVLQRDNGKELAEATRAGFLIFKAPDNYKGPRCNILTVFESTGIDDPGATDIAYTGEEDWTWEGTDRVPPLEVAAVGGLESKNPKWDLDFSTTYNILQ